MARQPGTLRAHPVFEIGNQQRATIPAGAAAKLVVSRPAVDAALDGEECVDAADRVDRQTLGPGSTTRSRGRCSGKGWRAGRLRVKATTLVVLAAACSAATSSSDVVLGRQIAFPPVLVLAAPDLLQPRDGRGRQARRIRLMGEAMQRIGQSAVMGQLIAGILLGLPYSARSGPRRNARSSPGGRNRRLCSMPSRSSVSCCCCC